MEAAVSSKLLRAEPSDLAWLLTPPGKALLKAVEAGWAEQGRGGDGGVGGGSGGEACQMPLYVRWDRNKVSKP